MQPYFTERFFNPSANYWAAQEVGRDMQAARETVAQTLGVRPTEIIFTAGGTESDNLAIHGVMRANPSSKLIVSGIEHDAVLHPAARYGAYQAKVTPQGFVDIEDIISNIDDETVLISLMLANNEIGTIQPVRELAQRLQAIRDSRRERAVSRPLYLHTDACQAANYLDLHVSRLGVDLMTLNGGKIYGPKQSGILYAKATVKLSPEIEGGGQERGLRSGTENVAGIMGFAAALSEAQALRQTEAQRLGQVQHHFVKALAKELPDASINGALKRRLPNNLHVTFPGIDNERLLMQLDEAGIMAAAGSACSASSDEPSHVLLAIGQTTEAARSSLRFSFGRATTEADIDRLVAALCIYAKSL